MSQIVVQAAAYIVLPVMSWPFQEQRRKSHKRAVIEYLTEWVDQVSLRMGCNDLQNSIFLEVRHYKKKLWDLPDNESPYL